MSTIELSWKARNAIFLKAKEGRGHWLDHTLLCSLCIFTDAPPDMFLKISGIIVLVLSSWSLSPSSSSSCMRPDPAPWSAGCLPDCLIWNGQRGAALIITLMGAFGKKDFEITFVIHVCVSVSVLVYWFGCLRPLLCVSQCLHHHPVGGFLKSVIYHFSFSLSCCVIVRVFHCS